MVRYLILGLVLVAAFGCERRSDVNEGPAQTAFNLRVWSQYADTCWEAEFALAQFDSLSEAIEGMKGYGIFGGDPVEPNLERDGWGRPFVWLKSESDGDIRIRILSCGKNGVMEEGSGDDIYIDLVYHGGKGKPEIYFKTTGP